MCNRPHLSSAAIGLFYGSPLRLRPLPTMDPLSISPVMQFDAIRCHCDAMRFPQPKPYLPDRDRVPMVQRSSRVSASTMHKGKSITAPYTAHRRISESTSTRISFFCPHSTCPRSVRDLRSTTTYRIVSFRGAGSQSFVGQGQENKSSPPRAWATHTERTDQTIFLIFGRPLRSPPSNQRRPAKAAKPSQTIQL